MGIVRLNIHKFIIVVIYILLVNHSISQSNIYKFNYITDIQGLSQNSIMAMHQDRLGQMWIGTRDGLNKYDGEEFTVYKHRKKDSTSISNNNILSIEEDSNGYIWVGTSYGLNKYNPKKNKFKTYFINEERVFIGSNMISVIKQLSNNEIWICTANGISIYQEESDSFKSVLEKRNITSLLETNSGDIIVGTNKGLLRLNNGAKSNFDFKPIIGSKDLYIQDIVEGNTGNVLVGTREHGLLELDISNDTLSSYFDKNLTKGKNQNIRKLLFDNEGKLWIATYNGLQISEHKNNLKVLYSDYDDERSINDNFIKTLFKDNHGVIWVGTYYGGVNMWTPSNKNFINITQKYSKAGLSFKVVTSIEQYKDFLLFGTAGGGISILNQKTNKVEYVTTKNTPALKGDNIKSLCVTENEQLWIGTFTNGIAIYDLNTKKIIELPFPRALERLLENVGVFSIVQYNSNIMLLGTTSKGIIKYNTATNEYKIFSRFTNPSLTSHNIKSIKVDDIGNIWVGTVRGLNRISKNEVITNYIYKKDLKVKFEINAIVEGENNVLWIGTSEDGLFKFENNTFKPIELKVGGSSIDGIKSILKVKDSCFWISTYTQGILKFNPKNNKIKAYYTNKDGLASNQFNRNASLKVGESQFYFGSPEGVIYFNESDLIKNNYSPKVIITDLKIKNSSISVNDKDSILKNTISYTEKIELDHNKGNFSLSFSIPSFINSKSNSYKYRLKGLETDWIETSNNEAHYTIQKPGEYIFEVKGINSDGIINETATKLIILVKPAPWFSWWAYTIYILAIISIMYYLLSVSKSKTKLKHELQLEHLEAEQLKKVNQAKLEFFTNISHEFRTPLTLILGPLQQILENYTGSSQMFEKLKVIHSNGKHLRLLIDRLMNFRKYEHKLVKIKVSESNIVEFLKEIYLSFYEYAKNGEYEYNFYTSSDEIMLFFDAEKLESVFFNLISNAFKYTPYKGKITIRIFEESDKVVISIEDNGIGIPEKYCNKIFERFFELQTSNNNEYKNGTGIGLAIAKNVVELHKGKIGVKSNSIEKGAIFKVELFKGKAHLNENGVEIRQNFSDNIDFYKNQLEQPLKSYEEDFYNKIPSDKKRSILLVEDNTELRKFMCNLLINDYNIYEVENGNKAYKLAVKEDIDIIISDVIMPIKSGIELCALIKQDIRTSHIPVILLTSRSTLMHKLEGLESGADDYISKPFDIRELRLRVENTLKSVARLKEKMNSLEGFQSENIALSSLDEKLYKKALEIIEKNISNDDFDIPYFCEELGVSRSVLFIKVKAWTDFTPKQFIKHIRLTKAAKLLEQGKMNVNQISDKVGFKNQKYFSISFKSKFGKTPSEYSQYFTTS